ncbi:MAG: hypothetical protein JOY62_17335 [Acidobacteriaceae bacterium]|nr:hypothetical protein [Acidobacteriaceae bacterium]MBV9781729.1 hypothetical protein [Acidobacteriaceae bacterium]
MTRAGSERPNFVSFSQLVQELISGTVDRHVFTQWELELLLDLQTCAVRKSARPDVLRRYLKAVQQNFSQDASAPLRLSAFLEQEMQQRAGSDAVAQPRLAVGARGSS